MNCPLNKTSSPYHETQFEFTFQALYSWLLINLNKTKFVDMWIV